ncbi:uncharacterized protein LOC129924852 [Biomphalaria glabrata]|uniref:Uncharacterized protein LOC129924852 n=1 Tax=Biomphalaria glabrata TaxID=6526 RepID=A0A9W2ZSW2_BIOGL|nr:uncharacterized protein LOC129924852 [Biomphalaria glabrata]
MSSILNLTLLNLPSTNQNEASIEYFVNTPLFTFLVITVPCTLIGLIDFAVNLINVSVFAAQGLNHPVEISLFTIAASDMIKVIFIMFDNLCTNSYADIMGTPLKLDEVFFVAGSFPLGCVSRITLHVTIYVTAERCLCILLPLQVKRIVTKNVTIICVSMIVALNLLALYPVYVTYFLAWNFYPYLNKTLLGFSVATYDPVTFAMTYFLHVILVVVGLFFLVISTSVLVWQLSRKTKWRMSHTSALDAHKVAIQSRDKKSMKMVVIVAISFAIGFTPLVVTILLAYYVPEFSFGGPLDALFHHLYSISLFSMSVNSSTNIIIFYKMSRKYRDKFKQIISLNVHRKSKIIEDI